MPGVKVGDVVAGRVTRVGSNVVLVTAQDARGKVAGLAADQVKVGDRLRLRIVELQPSGEFIAVRIEGA